MIDKSQAIDQIEVPEIFSVEVFPSGAEKRDPRPFIYGVQEHCMEAKHVRFQPHRFQCPQRIEIERVVSRVAPYIKNPLALDALRADAAGPVRPGFPPAIPCAARNPAARQWKGPVQKSAEPGQKFVYK